MRAAALALALAACGSSSFAPPAHIPELPPGPPAAPAAEMRIHLIDVGQGAATLIEFSCGAVLVDTGGESNAMFDSEQKLTHYLDRFFQLRPRLHRTLALLVLTHPHIDHTRSGLAVFQRYRVENVVTDGLTTSSGGLEQKALIDAADAAHVPQEKMVASAIPPAGAHDRVIDPISCADGDPDIRAFWGAGADDQNFNNDSVVMRFRLGKASFLITGDLEQDGIAGLLKRFAPELRADVLEVGHHGSWNATTQPLLDAIHPAVALISMGNPDRRDTWSAWAYGHPRRESIELLEGALTGARRPPIHVRIGIEHESFEAHDTTAPIYATGWDGDVVVTLHADGRIHVTAADLPVNPR